MSACLAVQSGMQESDEKVVELKGMSGPVLEALVGAMYGDFAGSMCIGDRKYPFALLLGLFEAADAHQVMSCIFQ